MIFSGQVCDYRCPACGYETQAQYSTALGYWACLFAVSCAVLFPILDRRFGRPHHGWMAWAVFAADLALLAILIPLATQLANLRVPADRKCPKCAASLERTGGGFYDFGFLPTLSDILVGLGFVLVHVVAIVLLLRK